MTRSLPLILFALLAAGCQSYQDGLKALCNAPATCGKSCQQAAPPDRMQVLSKHIMDVVKDGETLELYGSFATIPPAERAIRLQQEAAKAGLSDCPLAETFAAEP